jgi:UDP-glucose 4-epimerase
VYELIDAGHRVIVIDNLSNGVRSAVHSKASFYNADITDVCALDMAFKTECGAEPFDAVMHFAAKIVVPESVENPSLYYYNNVEGTRSLLDVMVKNRCKNIIFSSTAAVYGETETGVCDEKTPTKPASPYGETKLAVEKMIGWFAKAYGMNYCVFRYFNVAGAHSSLKIGLWRENMTHMIPAVVETAIGIRDRLIIFGSDYDTLDGTCVRDYIHVSDIAHAHLLAIDLLQKNRSEIINLGSSKGFSVKEVIDEVSKRHFVNFEYGNRRMGDVPKIVASNRKAKELLGWSPRLGLAEIINSDLAFRQKMAEIG